MATYVFLNMVSDADNCAHDSVLGYETHDSGVGTRYITFKHGQLGLFFIICDELKQELLVEMIGGQLNALLLPTYVTFSTRANKGSIFCMR